MNILIFDVLSSHIQKRIRQECGLNLSQTRILLFFAQSDNKPLKMGDLASSLNLSLSTLSRQLQQPNTARLIELKRSKLDSSKKIWLNEAGISSLKSLQKTLAKLDDQLFIHWENQDKVKFKRQLSMLVNSFD